MTSDTAVKQKNPVMRKAEWRKARPWQAIATGHCSEPSSWHQRFGRLLRSVHAARTRGSQSRRPPRPRTAGHHAPGCAIPGETVDAKVRRIGSLSSSRAWPALRNCLPQPGLRQIGCGAEVFQSFLLAFRGQLFEECQRSALREAYLLHLAKVACQRCPDHGVESCPVQPRSNRFHRVWMTLHRARACVSGSCIDETDTLCVGHAFTFAQVFHGPVEIVELAWCTIDFAWAPVRFVDDQGQSERRIAYA